MCGLVLEKNRFERVISASCEGRGFVVRLGFVVNVVFEWWLLLVVVMDCGYRWCLVEKPLHLLERFSRDFAIGHKRTPIPSWVRKTDSASPLHLHRSWTELGMMIRDGLESLVMIRAATLLHAPESTTASEIHSQEQVARVGA